MNRQPKNIARYEYPFIFDTIKDSGTAQIFTSDNSVETSVLFQSPNFSTHPPSESEALYSEASVTIEKIDFSGGGTTAVLNALESNLKVVLEVTMNEIASNEGDLLNDAMIDIVTGIGDFVRDTDEVPDERNDILLPEKNLQLPTKSSVANFSEGKMFYFAVEWINSIFGSMTDDISSPSGQDMGINKFLRSYLLSNGHLSFPATVLFDDGIIFEEKDLIHAKIELQNVRIIGLDTLSEFQPLDIVGNYTISNHFTWSYLEIEIDLAIIVSPPDKTDPMVIESATFRTKLDDVKLHLSFLIALEIADLKLGMLLNIGDSETLISCFSDALYSLQVSGLSATVTNIDSPTLSGFKSSGIDRITNDVLNGMFEIFGKILINILPTISEMKVRDFINSKIEEILEGGDSCQVMNGTTPNEYVNFFDLLLPEAESLLEGGNGKSPYGERGTILNRYREQSGILT